MKTLHSVTIILFIISLLTSSCRVSRNSAITTGELTGHIRYLSSDALKGRAAGSDGDSLAAVYIRDQLSSAGLLPLADRGFQRFSITNRIAPGKNNYLSIDDRSYDPDNDFMPFSFSGNGNLDAEVVFAGYGFRIDNDSLKWNDFENISVDGKWALILRGDPEPEKSVSGFIPFSSDRSKVLMAKDMGAAGVLLVSGPVNDKEDRFDPLSSADYSAGIPVLRVKRALGEIILEKQGKGIADLEKEINTNRTSSGFTTGVRVKAGSEIIREESTARNVIMMLPGYDPELKDEYVIVGAHFDHLGMGGPGSGSRAVDTTGVHHGADDNASGVGTMVELAEKFALTRKSSRRSIVFAAFSAEELGLLGSKHFVDNPVVDLKKVNVMINLDMVGRLQENRSVQVSGVGTAEGLRDLVSSVCDTGIIKLSLSDEGYGPSDHSSFYGRNIPVLFFTTGAHLDYHTPEDTWDKLNYEGMIPVSDLVYTITASLSNTTERLKFLESGPRTETMRTMRRRGVTLGIMPDFAGNVKNGLRADFVTPGKPAALGGMKKGDIIISINGKPVGDIQEYMFRMSQLKHGETISVEVLREGEKLVLLIQL